MFKAIHVLLILSNLLLSGCNVMGDQASFDDDFFRTPYKYDKVFFRHGNHFDIGDVGVGYTYQYEVIVENNSNDDVYISEVKAPDGAFAYGGAVAFPGNSGTCSSIITAYNYCTIYYEVTIASETYEETDIELSFYFSSDTGVTYPLKSKMSAFGQDKAILKADNSLYQHGYYWGRYVLNSAFTTPSITYTNINNTYSATISSGSTSGSSLFTWSGGTFPGGGTCIGPISPGGNCTVNLDFNPTSLGNIETFIGLTYDQGNNRGTTTHGVYISAEVVNPAHLLFSFTNKDFGSYSTDVSTVLSIKNDGEYDATSIFASWIGTNPSSFTVNNSCGNIYENETCEITITYLGGSQSTGTYTAGLDITYFDGQLTKTQTITLQGSTP